MAELYALSFIQPWATAVLLHGKDVENRRWAPWPRIIGKRIAVHAGAKFDKGDQWNLKEQLAVDIIEPPQSALLGTVEVMGYVHVEAFEAGHPNHPWFDGIHERRAQQALESRWRAADAKFLWVLQNPIVLPEPIPCPGSLSLWHVQPAHAMAMIANDPFLTAQAAHG